MNLKKILKDNGKSYTKEREVIFDKIKKLHHFSYADLENKLKNIGRASIFRNLNVFTEVGIIRIIDNKDGAIIYEINDSKHHHEHMKCIKCGSIIEFDDSEIHDLFEKIANKNNFKLTNHSLNFEGTCEKCIKKD